MNSLLTKTSMNTVTVLYNNTRFEPLTQNKGIPMSLIIYIQHKCAFEQNRLSFLTM